MLKKWFNIKGKIKANNDEYVMKEMYQVNNLAIGNLEYISGDYVKGEGLLKRTQQKYIFEDISCGQDKKYREVFTGYVLGLDAQGYYEMPYVVDVKRVDEVLPQMRGLEISKNALLALLNEVNLESKESVKLNKKA